jgi:hypothetical protein
MFDRLLDQSVFRTHAATPRLQIPQRAVLPRRLHDGHATDPQIGLRGQQSCKRGSRDSTVLYTRRFPTILADVASSPRAFRARAPHAVRAAPIVPARGRTRVRAPSYRGAETLRAAA